MPRYLFFALTIAIITFVAQAALAPLYETGAAIYSSSLLLLGAAGCLVSFAFRKQWAWRPVYYGCIAAAIINVAFFPTPRFFGSVTTASRINLTAQTLACLIIFLSMRSEKTKTWFRQPSPQPRDVIDA